MDACQTPSLINVLSIMLKVQLKLGPFEAKFFTLIS